jgi:8-oxo-dGTP diphosphatase/2-hydroxy-dATP diphosphatase
MWPDDEFWHPIVFGGKKFSGYFLFDGHDTIVSHTIDLKSELVLSG